ncbi:MAG: diphthamide biosynthesis enzyme Dph2 [Euryarchaeota archaeon]|nr:diphthamide biosynthesis enzyme Dph2 [Euryarchaeota archaeon]
MYDFELPRVVDTIKREGYTRVALQFPEGLADYAAGLAGEIERETGAEVIIAADPCYGACDPADVAMKALGVECLFHFGHSPILKKTAIPVEYVEVRMDADPVPLLEEHLELLCRRVGLFTTVQHVHLLDEVRTFLEGRGFEVAIGPPGGRAVHPGQVLGCSFRTAVSVAGEVDCYLYLGSGDFHPLGVALASRRPVFALDIASGELRDMAPLAERTLKQRYARMARAVDAGTFGIIVGQKRGQKRLKLALELKEKIEGRGREACLISADLITPETLMPFRRLDCLVNTACPRITIDDAQRYRQPLLSPQELEMVLGERDWEDYSMDEF